MLASGSEDILERLQGEMAVMKRTLLFGAACAVLLAGCCRPSAESKEKAEKAQKDYIAGLKVALQNIERGNIPQPGPCPKLKEKDEGYSGWDGFAQTVTNDLLSLLAEGGEHPSKEALEEWSWLSSTWIEEVIMLEAGMGKSDHQTKSHVYMLSKSPYIVVIAASAKRMPEAKGDEDFIAGEFDGSLVVFERESGKALCSAPVRVLSSEVVKYKKRGFFASSSQSAVENDFKKLFAEEASKALKKVAPTLKVSIY
jgi:hypothetical protein